MSDLIETVDDEPHTYVINYLDEEDEKSFSMDLSSASLKHLPVMKMDQLRHLYLDKNNLTELPDSLFNDAPNLQWLDARNNKISNIPSSIEDHKFIETILLQNNKLLSLPNYLGTLKNLKFLQLTGNPLLYPERSVIIRGTESVLKFLLSEYKEKKRVAEQEFIDILVSNREKEIKDNNNIKPNQSQENRKYLLYNEQYKIVKLTCFETINEECTNEAEAKNHENYTNLVEKPLPSYSNSNKYLKKLVPRDKDDMTIKMQETVMQEMWLEKKKELLNKREKVLQDRKSLQALKHWRTDYKESKVDNSNTYYALDLSNLPYDTNLDFVKILTRADIEKDLPDKYKKNIRNKCKIGVRKVKPRPNLQMKISEMMESINSVQDVGSDISRTCSPKEKQRIVAKQIKALTDLKKQILNLTLDNNNHL